MGNTIIVVEHNEEFIKGDTFDIFALGKGTGPWCYNKLLFDILSIEFMKSGINAP